jgi:hypothetical protein
MQLYKTTDKSQSILPFDIFEMLGLQDMTAKEKEEFESELVKLILRYFFQEKIGDRLSWEEKEKISDMQIKKIDDTQKFIDTIGDKVPNASDLLVESIVEVKSRVVRDHYQKRLDGYKKALDDLDQKEDKPKHDIAKQKIEECKLNLHFIEEERWELVASQIARKAAKNKNNKLSTKKK